MVEIKTSTKVLSDDLSDVKNEIEDILSQIPNTPHESVPAGSSSEENLVIFNSKTKANKDSVIPHWELAKKYDLIDFELGNKITGSGFPVYIKKGAKLIITVDCGISSVEQLKGLEKTAIDIIVIDHHEPGKELPPAYSIINPKNKNNKSGLDYLCAAGITFIVLIGLNR